eukprot:365728-Chlamydomonas_euryale.AAC.4
MRSCHDAVEPATRRSHNLLGRWRVLQIPVALPAAASRHCKCGNCALAAAAGAWTYFLSVLPERAARLANIGLRACSSHAARRAFLYSHSVCARGFDTTE